MEKKKKKQEQKTIKLSSAAVMISTFLRTPCCNYSKIWTSPFGNLMMCKKVIAEFQQCRPWLDSLTFPDKALFSTKNILIFYLFLHKNICCGHSSEASWRGAFNEYPQHIFLWRTKKNIYLVHPLFWSYETNLVWQSCMNIQGKIWYTRLFDSKQILLALDKRVYLLFL